MCATSLLPVPMADITNGAGLSCPWRPNIALKPFSSHPVLQVVPPVDQSGDLRGNLLAHRGLD